MMLNNTTSCDCTTKCCQKSNDVADCSILNNSARIDNHSESSSSSSKLASNLNVAIELKPVTHVIFDLDGLLIDSEVCFARGIERLLKNFGINEYPKALQQKVLGMEVARGIEEIIRVTGIPISVEQFMIMEREYYTEEMLKAELMPGAKRLVDHFSKHNVPMAIATGSTTESYLIKTKRHQDLFEKGKYFNHIVFTRDDPEVKRPKPAPDVYQITASRFPTKPAPQECLVFEDSSIGVDGAIAAGMQCVMVPDSRFECNQKNATMILKSLEQFRPELFGLPPFE
ncbi:Pseudouridine-5'-phosphatase [Sarcoptes scabiei]|uniref:Pseudouridine-5'-phosphatase n=1 Tax=Sarcoptes scabiei TaxID=52283 RepID=A0A834VI66_SARSC|nr:Pseudouridine-5'-phosphatase [Sarcoptes scabiei]